MACIVFSVRWCKRIPSQWKYAKIIHSSNSYSTLVNNDGLLSINHLNTNADMNCTITEGGGQTYFATHVTHHLIKFRWRHLCALGILVWFNSGVPTYVHYLHQELTPSNAFTRITAYIHSYNACRVMSTNIRTKIVYTTSWGIDGSHRFQMYTKKRNFDLTQSRVRVWIPLWDDIQVAVKWLINGESWGKQSFVW